MSTGSNNIVIAITDQIDPGIQAKIAGIGAAANQASTQLTMLKVALATATGGAASLGGAALRLPGQLNPVTSSTGRLTGAIAQLLGRVVGAEAGFGMLGGAFARVGVAASVAGPLIIAALAIGAVVGAILIYNKFEEAARKLTQAQIDQNEAITSQNNRILVLKEELIGLTEGPMAKYRAQLADLSKMHIEDDLSKITKVLDDQKSHWADLIGWLQKYGTELEIVTPKTFLWAAIVLPKIPEGTNQNAFSITDAKDFLNNTKNTREALEAEGSAEKALLGDMATTGAKLVELHKLEDTLTDRNLANTEVARKAIQQHFSDLLRQRAEFNAKQAILVAGANGELITEQKAAAAEQLRAFNEELARMKEASDKVGPQDILDLRKKQLSGDQTGREVTNSLAQLPAFRGNVQPLERDIGGANQAVIKQNIAIGELIDKYNLAVAAGAAYSDELKSQQSVEAALLAIRKSNLPLTAIEIANIVALAKANVDNERVNHAMATLYSGSLKSATLEYNATLAASSQLLKDNALSAAEKSRIDIIAAKTLKDIQNPLNEYEVGLQNEIKLFGKYGTELEAATEVEALRQQLLAKGIEMTSTQADGMRKFVTILQQQRQIQTEVNQLQQENAGLVQNLITHQIALNVAKDKGHISEVQFRLATAQTNVALANQALQFGKGATLGNQLVSTLGKMTADYHGLSVGITEAYGKAGQQAVDGFSNSLARAIVYGEDLGAAMANVARTIATDLISSFIKMGIQWLLNELISKSIQQASVAAAVAAGTETALAWSTAAAMADIATFGAASAAGDIALSTSVGLSAALAAFAHGGPVNGIGTSTSDSILARLSNGEFVVKASATAKNRPLLEAINNGAIAVSSNGSGGSVGGTSMNVHVTHDGSTAIAVQQIDENTVRIIAKQEAKDAVTRHAPQVIAADMQNPNSRTSKAVNLNLVAPRKR